jgi:peptide/nickel transport system permease protein
MTAPRRVMPPTAVARPVARRERAFLQAFCHSPTALLGGGLLLLIAVVALAGGRSAPTSATLVRVESRLRPPLARTDGERHWLGTDALGRDILRRLAVGAHLSLTIGASGVLVGGVLGTTLGLLSGYAGGRLDRALMRIGDMQLAFPSILLALVMLAVVGPGLRNIIIVLGLASWVTYARVVRAEVLSLKEREFVVAARALGAPLWRILTRHLVPSVTGLVVVIATFSVGTTILAESGLSFLGLGAGGKTPTWGVMLADAREYLTDAWWLTTFPGLAILLTVLGLNLVGEWLRDYLDPWLQ